MNQSSGKTMEKLITTAEAAALLDRSQQIVLDWGRLGRLPRRRANGKDWLYREDDVLALKAAMAAKMARPDGTLTLRETAEYLGLSMEYVRLVAQRAGLRPVQVGGNTRNLLYFKRSDVDAYAALRASTVRADRLATPVPAKPAKPAPSPAHRFVLPDVMRNWPILDERDRAPTPPPYGSYKD
ncbi:MULTISPECIES: helix-turn-helix domain-containing protein [Burkholderiaceae]|uniref:helix-turn-helix domain-containing protein n=1 Tax=Burkholderiaceae TaxID=119060 RepID=UPI00161D27D4|nr:MULTISPECIES: helix-turn-helix domain-containing protein [Burkholderiaceae]MBB2981625.1 excisionase family DNA binding protein [Paraburkholderia tropica]